MSVNHLPWVRCYSLLIKKHCEVRFSCSAAFCQACCGPPQSSGGVTAPRSSWALALFPSFMTVWSGASPWSPGLCSSPLGWAGWSPFQLWGIQGSHTGSLQTLREKHPTHPQKVCVINPTDFNDPDIYILFGIYGQEYSSKHQKSLLPTNRDLWIDRLLILLVPTSFVFLSYHQIHLFLNHSYYCSYLHLSALPPHIFYRHSYKWPYPLYEV